LLDAAVAMSRIPPSCLIVRIYVLTLIRMLSHPFLMGTNLAVARGGVALSSSPTPMPTSLYPMGR
jgi:hypothetical protein